MIYLGGVFSLFASFLGTAGIIACFLGIVVRGIYIIVRAISGKGDFL